MRKYFSSLLICGAISLLFPAWNALAQPSLTLTSATVTSGSAASLNLSLSSPTGVSVDSVQWTVTYPSAMSNVAVKPGAALTAAGKTLTCAAASGGYACVAEGINANAIADGVVAVVSGTVSGSSPAAIGVGNALAAASDGTAVPMTATGGTVGILPAGTVTVNSLACNPAALNPGATAACTVTLTGPAGSGGANVSLASSGSITLPGASVNLAAGAASTTFSITAGQFTSDQGASLTASLNGSSTSASLSLTVPRLVSSVQCAASSLASNANTTCTVTLNMAAPAGGVTVAISGAIANILTLPASVAVAANATSASFAATTGALSASQTATVAASLNGSSKSVSLSLTAPLLISSLQCAASSLASATSTTCTITLNMAAPAGGVTVTISGAIANILTLPASVAIPAAATSASFTAAAAAIPSNQTATITASMNGSSKSASVSLSNSSGISTLQCALPTLAPNATTTCTVTLSAAAPAGGAVVSLTSSTTALKTAASVAVPAGAASATFPVTTGALSSNQSATLTASFNKSSVTSTLTLSTLALSSLQCTATTLAPGATTTCTATLTGSVPAGATATIAVSTNNSTLNVLVSQAIVPGSSNVVHFPVSANPFTTNQTATLTAFLDGASVSVNFTLTAPATVSVSTLKCAAASLVSNVSISCTVTLSAAAPAGGSVVALSGGIANVLTVPASTTVAANSTTGTFTISTAAITSDQTATVAASLNGSRVTLSVPLTAPVMISALQCAAPSLPSNGSTTCTISLNKAAPSTGAPVTVSGAIANVLAVPASATVVPNALTATFGVSTASVSTAQTATITATYGSKSASTNLSLVAAAQSTPALASLACSPLTATSTSGTCTVALVTATPSKVSVALKSGNAALVVPATATIVAGATSVSFEFTLSPNPVGWLSIVATLGNLSKSVTLTIGQTAKTLSVSCPPSTSSGSSIVCEAQVYRRSGHGVNVRLSSSSHGVSVPALLSIPAGQRSARFQALTDPAAPSGTATLSAAAEDDSAQASVRVEANTAAAVKIAGDTAVKAGSPLRLEVSAVSVDGFPVSLAASRIPPAAAFDPQSGIFEWTPAAGDLGDHTLVFTATNTFGASVSRSLAVRVGSGTPELNAMLNAAGPSAPAACASGSAATLSGKFLSAANPQDTRVWVNGSQAGVLFASPERIDFLCPNSAPGTTLEISVENGSLRSNTLKSVMQADAPGILALEQAGSLHALAFHADSAEMAALPNPAFAAHPASAGETLSLLATGLSCDASFPSGRPQFQLGSYVVPVAAIEPASQRPGVCQVSFVVPAGLSGDAVPVTLQSLHYDGTLATSNVASIAVAEQQ